MCFSQDITWEYVRLTAIAFSLSVVFAIAWGCGLAVPMTEFQTSKNLQYIFSIAIILLGGLFFVLHVICMADARQAWINCFRCLCCCTMPPKQIIPATNNTASHSQPITHDTSLFYANKEAEDPPETTVAASAPPQVEVDLGEELRAESPGHLSLESQTLRVEFAQAEESGGEEISGELVEMQPRRVVKISPIVEVHMCMAGETVFMNTQATTEWWQTGRDEELEEEETGEEEDTDEEEEEEGEGGG